MSTDLSRAARPDRLTMVAFATSILLAGGSAIGVKLTVAELPPFWGATLRFASAGLLLLAVVAVRRTPLPRGERLLGSILYGVFGFGLAFMFGYWALQTAPASTTQTLLATVPLATLLLAVGQRIEPFRIQGLVGATIAAAGIVLVFGDGTALDVPLPALVAILLGAVCFGEAGVVAKRFPPGDPIAANAVAMLCGAALLGLLTLATGEPVILPARLETWLAVGYLVLFGSIGVFVLSLHVLARWTATAASYAFLLVPLVTIALAAVLLGEPVQPVFLVGGTLVVTGVYVGAFAGESRAPRAARPAARPMAGKRNEASP
ncbi:MAG: EamA family transporter [Chloroflexi bacterium]|jgi:drug/metabolite transporter (DMT)-like permease|nr:EamA family transporter [Chloroflexota bacterium]